MKTTLLSLAIAFHLVVIVLYPNSASYLQQRLLPVLLPYASTFGLNSKWQFFAPEPEIATYFEYEIDWKDRPVDLSETNVYTWPPKKRGFFDLTYTRRNASRSFMVNDPRYLKSIFIPWVCRQNPRAAGVSVRPAYIKVPTLMAVRNGQPLFDPSHIHFEEAVTASCEEALQLEEYDG